MVSCRYSDVEAAFSSAGGLVRLWSSSAHLQIIKLKKIIIEITVWFKNNKSIFVFRNKMTSIINIQ